jgi:hypothetical protein
LPWGHFIWLDPFGIVVLSLFILFILVFYLLSRVLSLSPAIGALPPQSIQALGTALKKHTHRCPGGTVQVVKHPQNGCENSTTGDEPPAPCRRPGHESSSTQSGPFRSTRIRRLSPMRPRCRAHLRSAMTSGARQSRRLNGSSQAVSRHSRRHADSASGLAGSSRPSPPGRDCKRPSPPLSVMPSFRETSTLTDIS